MRSDTQSTLATFRSCPQKYRLGVQLQLALLRDDEREALAVGATWHEAHRVGIEAIGELAPSDRWREVLARLFVAHEWYWRDQPLDVKPEVPFDVVVGGRWRLRGMIDGVGLAGGRSAILERKTTSEDLSASSWYWRRLRLDAQVGIYGMVAGRPEAIVYDVVRKPTIRPARITKKDAERIAREVQASGSARYYGEDVGGHEAMLAVSAGQESLSMFGARLTSDIGDRPEFYFARREVPRSSGDYDALASDVIDTLSMIDWCEANDSWPRNPSACHQYGTCEFFSLCSTNAHRSAGAVLPDGFTRKPQRHPELPEMENA